MPRSGPGRRIGWPSRMILPEVIGSKPAIKWRSVLLPQPDGPTRAMNSPCSTARSNPSIATTDRPFRRYSCRRLLISSCIGGGTWLREAAPFVYRARTGPVRQIRQIDELVHIHRLFLEAQFDQEILVLLDRGHIDPRVAGPVIVGHVEIDRRRDEDHLAVEQRLARLMRVVEEIMRRRYEIGEKSPRLVGMLLKKIRARHQEHEFLRPGHAGLRGEN